MSRIPGRANEFCTIFGCAVGHVDVWRGWLGACEVAEKKVKLFRRSKSIPMSEMEATTPGGMVSVLSLAVRTLSQPAIEDVVATAHAMERGKSVQPRKGG